MDGILLLAGNSARFGENKLLYPVNGEKMYRHIWHSFQYLREKRMLDHLLVVTQYEEILQELEGESCVLIQNSNPEKGISHSIYLALEALGRIHPYSKECIFSVGDQPYLKTETLLQFVAEFHRQPYGIAACATEKRVGNPTIFSQKYYGELMALSGDVGGKQVMKNHEEDVFSFPVSGEELEDVDVKPLL